MNEYLFHPLYVARVFKKKNEYNLEELCYIATEN